MVKWTSSDNYGGEDMSEYYVLYSKTRDSGPLARSNFERIREEMGIEEGCYENEAGTVRDVHFGHWVCGWIDAIMIHESDQEAVDKGNDISTQLSMYPVFDEDHFCSLQYEEAAEYWQNASLWERVDICRDAGVSIFAARREKPESEVLYQLEAV